MVLWSRHHTPSTDIRPGPEKLPCLIIHCCWQISLFVPQFPVSPHLLLLLVKYPCLNCGILIPLCLVIYPCVFYLTRFPHVSVSTTSDRVAIAVHPSIAVANHPGAPNQAWPRAPGIAVDRLACYADSVIYRQRIKILVPGEAHSVTGQWMFIPKNMFVQKR